VRIENSPNAPDLPFDNGTTEGGIGVDRRRTIAACFDGAFALHLALVARSRIVLAAAAGEPHSEIARRLQLTRDSG